MLEQNRVFLQDPEILGGQPVFCGTRVPVRILFDYLEGGDNLDIFLDDFPSVTREQVISMLEIARQAAFLSQKYNAACYRVP